MGYTERPHLMQKYYLQVGSERTECGPTPGAHLRESPTGNAAVRKDQEKNNEGILPGTPALFGHSSTRRLAPALPLKALCPGLFTIVALRANRTGRQRNRPETPAQDDAAKVGRCNSAPHTGKAYRFREFSEIRRRNREHPHVHLIKRVRRAASSGPTGRGVHEDFINPL